MACRARRAELLFEGAGPKDGCAEHWPRQGRSCTQFFHRQARAGPLPLLSTTSRWYSLSGGVLPAGPAGGCLGCIHTTPELTDLVPGLAQFFHQSILKGLGEEVAVPRLAPAQSLHGSVLLPSSPIFCGCGVCRSAWQ